MFWHSLYRTGIIPFNTAHLKLPKKSLVLAPTIRVGSATGNKGVSFWPNEILQFFGT